MVPQLIKHDLEEIFSNGILLAGTLAPLLMAGAINWGIPYINGFLITHFEWTLEEYFPLLSAMIFLTAPGLMGFVLAFLILDERDSGLIRYFLVTPMGERGYFLYRMGLPMIIGGIMTLLLMGLQRIHPFPTNRLALVLPLIILEIPFYALVLTGLARNKVEGLAMAKGVAMTGNLPLLVYLTGLPILPFYLWPSFFILQILLVPDSPVLLFFTGLLYHTALLGVLWRRFSQNNS